MKIRASIKDDFQVEMKTKEGAQQLMGRPQSALTEICMKHPIKQNQRISFLLSTESIVL